MAKQYKHTESFYLKQWDKYNTAVKSLKRVGRTFVRKPLTRTQFIEMYKINDAELRKKNKKGNVTDILIDKVINRTNYKTARALRNQLKEVDEKYADLKIRDIQNLSWSDIQQQFGGDLTAYNNYLREKEGITSGKERAKIISEFWYGSL